MCRITSVAAFWNGGGGGGGGARPSLCTDMKQKVTYMRERAKRANASETYIFRSPNISAHSYNQFPFITYGMALYSQYNDKILTLR